MLASSSAGAPAAPLPTPAPTLAPVPEEPGRPRVVLDSNIWVDLLVFRDPRVEAIRTALEDGAIQALIRADCREELRRVLEYPQFVRFAVDNSAALAMVDRLTTCVPLPAPAEAEEIRLPRCRDTDDQKFLELAHHAQAACLVSKDKAVLKMRSRMRRTSGVDIMLPAAFAPWLAARLPT